MLSLIIYGGFSLQNSGRCSGNSTVNGHSFQSSRDSESWETVRKSPSHLSQTPTIPAHVVRSHWFCGKNNWNEEFRKWQSYIVIEHQTLNDLEKVKWMELVPAFEAGNAGQMEKWDGSSLLVWGTQFLGNPGIPVWSLAINVELCCWAPWRWRSCPPITCRRNVLSDHSCKADNRKRHGWEKGCFWAMEHLLFSINLGYSGPGILNCGQHNFCILFTWQPIFQDSVCVFPSASKSKAVGGNTVLRAYPPLILQSQVRKAGAKCYKKPRNNHAEGKSQMIHRAWRQLIVLSW